ncbi:MAG: 30S ribosomal protein S12 methylthiotransferase RimO [Bacteroidales bacterium]|jgi:ribosomal protein S12 methylthiotransferase
MKAGLVSLGCAKNLVDSEMILGILKNAGVEIVSDPQTADVIIVNTCGFIESAKQEALDTIHEMAGFHKKLLVCGCFAQRYPDNLRTIEGINRIVTLKDYPHFGKILNDLFKDKNLKFGEMDFNNRLLATSVFTPYVKISDGCDNRCAYCAIPLIRGNFRSRRMEDILSESVLLAQNGAKELNIISQDTTRYGTDLTKDHTSLLPELLKKLCQIEGIELVRVLYLYPDEITDELLNVFQNTPKMAHYFDIPIQHVSSSLLKQMNRRGNEDLLVNLLTKIKTMMPDAILRTTLIVGFPGETPADFDQLKHFIQSYPFDRMGVFAYSKEEDTVAFDLPNQVPEDVKQARLDEIMKLQKTIASKKNKEQIGKTHKTIVENFDRQSKFYYGRSYAFAPDDVDGYIVFQSKKKLKIGDIANVKITSTFSYDLIGDAIE